MEYQEVKKPAMKFVGFGIDTSVQNALIDCPKVWEQFKQRHKEVQNSSDNMKHYGVSVNPNQAECSFRYIASAEVSEFEEIPEGMEKVEIPKETYFVFIHKGKKDKIGETYCGIMEEIPKTRMKQKEEFWVEFYDQRWKEESEDSEFEIWIPVEEAK